MGVECVSFRHFDLRGAGASLVGAVQISTAPKPAGARIIFCFFIRAPNQGLLLDQLTPTMIDLH